MQIKLAVFLFLYTSLLACQAGATQYQPIASSDNSEISWNINLLQQKTEPKTMSVNYTFYINEINQKIFSENLKKALYLGVTFGGKIFQKNTSSLCENASLFLTHMGGRARLNMVEFFKPFFEFGYTKESCIAHFGLSKITEAKWQAVSSYSASRYLAAGLVVSFKILDRVALYNLDQDYGINDIGFNGRCVNYLDKPESDWSCEAGLLLAF